MKYILLGGWKIAVKEVGTKREFGYDLVAVMPIESSSGSERWVRKDGLLDSASQEVIVKPK